MSDESAGGPRWGSPCTVVEFSTPVGATSVVDFRQSIGVSFVDRRSRKDFHETHYEETQTVFWAFLLTLVWDRGTRINSVPERDGSSGSDGSS